MVERSEFRLKPHRLAEQREQMRRAFNELVPRRALGWRTAVAMTTCCSQPKIDRDELFNEVNERRCSWKKWNRSGAIIRVWPSGSPFRRRSLTLLRQIAGPLKPAKRKRRG